MLTKDFPQSFRRLLDIIFKSGSSPPRLWGWASDWSPFLAAFGERRGDGRGLARRIGKCVNIWKTIRYGDSLHMRWFMVKKVYV